MMQISYASLILLSMNPLLPMLLLAAVLWTGSLAAQPREAPDADASTRYLWSLYEPYRDNTELLFDGRQYFPSRLITQGHPYFPEDRIMAGAVRLENHEITGVQLRYNAYRNLLIFVPESRWLGEIVLNPNRITGFDLENHRFAHLKNFPPMAGIRQASPLPGYYEVLYEGQVALYVRRSRRFLENLGDTFNQGKYWANDSRYLVRDGRTYVIKKKKSLMRALDEQTGALRTFMRKSKFQWGIATDADFRQLLQFYDTL